MCASLAALSLAAVACEPAAEAPAVAEASPQPAPENPVAEALQPLRDRERVLRGQMRPPWSAVSGPDPVAVQAWGEGFVGLLRTGAVVSLDPTGHELARTEVHPGAAGWNIAGETVAVVSEGSPSIQLLRLGSQGPRLTGEVVVAGATGLRSIAAKPGGGWWLADRHRGRILSVDARGQVQGERACGGALQVVHVQRWVAANCMLDHRVEVFEATDELQPVASVTHDGPMWSLGARAVEGTLELAVGGVEDHPLERRDGSFGYIDSFVFVLRLNGDALERQAAVNVGAHGVVTPKFVAWHDSAWWASGAGGMSLVRIEPGPAPNVQAWSVPAGLTGLAWRGQEMLAADPLLDQWVHLDAQQQASWVEIDSEDARTDSQRLGEALVFTTLLAPRATTEGRNSRFTCETCHFEGTVDGRVHYTGRADVHASTKTLRGLVGNHPHFSRALDRSTVDMIHNEFRVANANTEQDPWFALDTTTYPWLAALTSTATWQPAQLRGAVLEFLAIFTPDGNPAVARQGGYSPLQRRGAERFAQACEGCHQARRVADDPGSRLPFEAWEADLFATGSILWASEQRHRTGVEPYVHEDGPRVPSLRRLWVKRPYLTQGTAPTLDAVLLGFREGSAAVHGAGEGAQLSAEDRAALVAFLDLL